MPSAHRYPSCQSKSVHRSAEGAWSVVIGSGIASRPLFAHARKKARRRGNAPARPRVCAQHVPAEIDRTPAEELSAEPARGGGFGREWTLIPWCIGAFSSIVAEKVSDGPAFRCDEKLEYGVVWNGSILEEDTVDGRFSSLLKDE